jgi:hypothetical protein
MDSALGSPERSEAGGSPADLARSLSTRYGLVETEQKDEVDSEPSLLD